MQVIVDGLATSYLRSGPAQAKGFKQVLILHGWADPSARWQAFIDELSQEYDVIMPDLPGFGGTQQAAEAWDVTDYAQFVASFIKKLGLKPYAIVSHSNGGGIAIRGLAKGIFNIDRLVLLASAGIRGEFKGRNIALRSAAKTGKLLTKPLPDKVRRRLRRKLYQTVGSDLLVSEKLQATFKKIVEDDVRADAAKLKVPTLLVYGERDNQTPVRYGEMFHELIDDSTLEVLPKADHFLYRHEQHQVIAIVKDFLK